MLHVVIPLFGVVKSGGLRVLVELANGMVERGHIVVFIKIGKGEMPFDLSRNVRVLSLCVDNRLGFFLKNASAFLSIYKNLPKDADVIVSNYYTSAYIGSIASLLRGVRHVYFVQDYEADFFQKSKRLSCVVKRSLAVVSYLLPSRIITISEYILSKLPVVSRGKTTIINDGVDAQVFKPLCPCDAGEPIRIMTIARSDKRKGLSDFVGSLNLLAKNGHEFTAIFVSNEKELNITAGYNYEMHSPKSDQELALLYRRATIFVSTSYFEGFGLPPLEAMACGVAVVTTDSGGVNEYAIDGENCLMVPVGDVKAIHDAINKLIQNVDLRARLGENGVHTASKFTWDIMVDKFESELLKVCEKL